jgi:hypothetical protein
MSLAFSSVRRDRNRLIWEASSFTKNSLELSRQLRPCRAYDDNPNGSCAGENGDLFKLDPSGI